MPETNIDSPVLTLPKCENANFAEAMDGGSFQNLALRGDMMAGPSTFLSKMAAGPIAPWHWYNHTEELVVLKGTIVAQLEGHDPVRIEAGGYSQLPGGHKHRFRCTDEGECLVFVVDEGAFDLYWVDAEGREITIEEADRLALEEGTDW